MDERRTERSGPVRVGYVLKRFPRISETFILNEILGLEERGVEVSVFSLRLPDEGRWHGDLSRIRGTVTYLPSLSNRHVAAAFRRWSRLGWPHDPEGLNRLLELLDDPKLGQLLVQATALAHAARQRGIRHVHAHFMTLASHTACLAHFLTGIPFSVTAHAMDIFKETVDPRVFRVIARAAARLVTVTDFNERYIAKHLLNGETGDKVVRVYNGLPLADLGPPAPGPRPLDVLAVGRLVPKKGFHVLLQACRLLADEGRPVRVDILGDGEERRRLRALRRDLRLEKLVRFHGAQPREAVLAMMDRARVLAAPCVVADDGNKDALPTVILEALARGLPPVATRLNGIPEMVEDGVEGRLVAQNDAPGLARALRSVLDDAAAWRRFSDAGRRKVEARFDRDRTLPQLMEVFGVNGTASGRSA